MVEPTTLRTPKWNIFARELERILQARGYGLGHLDDRSRIHPEKVRRLQRSLREPRFHLLSPDELERVGDAFNFTPEERMQLRAALLATAVEDMLMSRIEASAALVASDQVFDILLDALQTHGDDDNGIGAVKGTPQVDAVLAQASQTLSSASSAAFEAAIDDVEGAFLLLHLSLTAESPTRLRSATLAREGFRYALAALDQLGAVGPLGDEWTYWRGEAQRGVALAETYLRQWTSGNQAKQ